MLTTCGSPWDAWLQHEALLVMHDLVGLRVVYLRVVLVVKVIMVLLVLKEILEEEVELVLKVLLDQQEFQQVLY